MKNYFFYAVIILLSTTNFSNTLFAQSYDVKHKAINNYIKSILKDSINEEIFISKEKINTNITIEILKKKWIYVINSDGKWYFDELFFDENSWKKMEKEYQNKCVPGNRIWCNDDYWTKENFDYDKVTLESMNTHKGIELIFEKYNKSDIKVYGFSDPIYYRNKKYVIFAVNISGPTSSNTYIQFMKKSKDKWTTTHQGRDPDLIN